MEHCAELCTYQQREKGTKTRVFLWHMLSIDARTRNREKSRDIITGTFHHKSLRILAFYQYFSNHLRIFYFCDSRFSTLCFFFRYNGFQFRSGDLETLTGTHT